MNHELESDHLKKLVRDRIPKIVEKKTKTATFHQANSDEYDHFLRKKLQEEIDEFLENPCLEEIADIIEVLEAFCNQMGFSLQKMEEVRKIKAKNKGKFHQRWIMTKKMDPIK